MPINSNHINDISIYIYCDTTLKAPLPSNSIIGYLTVSVNSKNIITLNIKNTSTIDKKNSLDFLNDIFSSYIYHLESIFFQ